MSYRPDHVNIGGHKTLIRIGKQDAVMERLKNIGEFDREEFTIDIKSGLSGSYTNQIIVHEILHAFFRIADISGVDDTLEEALCHGLENVFYRFLVDNDLSWVEPQPEINAALDAMRHSLK